MTGGWERAINGSDETLGDKMKIHNNSIEGGNNVKRLVSARTGGTVEAAKAGGWHTTET